MNAAKRSLQFMQMCNRQLGQSAVRNSSASVGQPSKYFYKLKETQVKFQQPDGLPVHLKKGLPDKLLYQFTFLCIFIGTGMMGKLFYTLSVK